MAKQGMKRPDRTHFKPRNTAPEVPEIQGKAKHAKVRANPIISETSSPSQKVFHSDPYSISDEIDRPVSKIYPAIDNDLAKDNLENDMTNADIQDL